jgi:chorismate synthase
MSSNSFGKLLTVTTFGESHGPAIGCVIDGCPPGLAITAEDFRADLDRRATGAAATPRSGTKPTTSKSSPACTKAAPRARRSRC